MDKFSFFFVNFSLQSKTYTLADIILVFFFTLSTRHFNILHTQFSNLIIHCCLNHVTIEPLCYCYLLLRQLLNPNFLILISPLVLSKFYMGHNTRKSVLAQLQRLTRLLKFYLKQVWLLNFPDIYNKGSHQTAHMHRLVYAFVVRMLLVLVPLQGYLLVF